MQNLEQLVPPLIDLCEQAGAAICRHYHAPGELQIEAKADDSPLTRADIDSHHLLRKGLAKLTPDWPVLSEESSAEHTSQRHQWRRYWLVDPLDGTKEFVAGTGEFTINVALIVDHRPVLGLLYLPLTQQAYVGIPGNWARCYQRDQDGNWGWQAIHSRLLLPGQPVAVLASRRHRGQALAKCLDWIESQHGPIVRFNSGSALKFCDLAAGRGDFYPRFSPCCEWDVAAGQALLEAAGGAIWGLDGQPLQYNRRQSLFSPHFLAVADAEHTLWQRYVMELAGKAE